MADAPPTGLNKAAANRQREQVTNAPPAPLNPAFPYESDAFPSGFFGVTTLSNKEISDS